MRFTQAYLFIFLLLMLCCIKISAQQSSSDLPSLFNNNKTVDEDSISDVNMLKQKMFVKVTASKHKVFVGEPIMVTYEFYSSLRLNNQPTVAQQPQFTGWS